MSSNKSRDRYNYIVWRVYTHPVMTLYILSETDIVYYKLPYNANNLHYQWIHAV